MDTSLPWLRLIVVVDFGGKELQPRGDFALGWGSLGGCVGMGMWVYGGGCCLVGVTNLQDYKL